MLVKAHFPHGGFGFYGGQRQAHGDQFKINPDHFSKKWMIEIKEEKKPARKAAKKVEEGAS